MIGKNLQLPHGSVASTATTHVPSPGLDDVRPADFRWEIANFIWQFFHANTRTRLGRGVQLFEVFLFAVLALAGILVQVYTDVEVSKAENSQNSDILTPFALINALYDVIFALREESRVFFLYTNDPYDEFLLKTRSVTGTTDSTLLLMDDWPSDADLLKLPAVKRLNVTSSATLIQALRNQRLLRKFAGNDTQAEIDILNFYYKIIDTLADLARTIMLRIPRFYGWSEILARHNFIEMEGQAQRMYRIGRKFLEEGRIVTPLDPVFVMFVAARTNYVELVSITGLDSTFTEDQINNNYTQQDGVLDFLSACADITSLDYSDLNVDLFDKKYTLFQASIDWLLDTVLQRVSKSANYHTQTWNTAQVASIVLLIVSSVIGFGGIFFHIAGTRRLQAQIDKNNKQTLELEKLKSVLYDFIPRSMITLVRSGQSQVPRISKDVCLLMLDVNATAMMEGMKVEQFGDFLSAYYLAVESTLAKYNCFKVAIVGDIFCVGSGAGEPHDVDHVMEMVYIALELQHRVAELQTQTVQLARLRIGIHAGTGVVQILSLQVPQMCIFGQVAEVTSLIHATGLPLRVQISAPVYQRLINCADIEVIRRGTLTIPQGDNVVLYWASSVEVDLDPDDLLSRASTSSVVAAADEEDEEEEDEQSRASKSDLAIISHH